MNAKKDDVEKKAEAAVEEKPVEAGKEKKEKAKEEKVKEKKVKEEKTKEKKAGSSSKTVEKIVELVEKMTVLELSDLVKVLEDHFGVTAAAPMAMMAAAPGAAAEAEEKTEFNVMLNDFGSQKIQVIKVVRAITGAGLIEAKKIVESVPVAIKEAVSKNEAEEIKKKIEEVGAVVEIK